MPAAMAGGAAGIVNGFFGGGGGMVLVPLLMSRCGLDRRRAFANSVAIIFPLCALSAVIYYVRGHLDVLQALPYLIGGLIGGLIYLTSFAALDQHQAQGINLLYFLPAAAAALPSHAKNGLLEQRIILPAVVTGLAAAGLTAWLSNALDTSVLRKLFGLFLLYIGLTELFRKDKPTQDTKDSPPAPNGKRTGT